LNVFTPLLAQSPPPTPLPVMIFITGGNFQFLDASAPIYESERFVNTTNTVLVFIQYRLGKKLNFICHKRK
jgi:carboxylesterase type B